MSTERFSTPNDAVVTAAHDDLLAHWYAMGKRRTRVEALIAAARAQGEREGLRRAELEIGAEARTAGGMGYSDSKVLGRALLAISSRVRKHIDNVLSGDPVPQKGGA